MKIKMTNAQMEEAIEALNTHTEETGRIGYTVARNLRILKEEATDFFRAKTELVMKYGELQDEEKGFYRILKENIPQYKEELSELEALTLEPDVYLMEEETFIGWGLTAAQMEPLAWMVDWGQNA